MLNFEFSCANRSLYNRHRNVIFLQIDHLLKKYITIFGQKSYLEQLREIYFNFFPILKFVVHS